MKHLKWTPLSEGVLLRSSLPPSRYSKVLTSEKDDPKYPEKYLEEMAQCTRSHYLPDPGGLASH